MTNEHTPDQGPHTPRLLDQAADPTPQPARSPTRITANFTPRAVAALASVTEVTGENNTDILNRAVQVYAYLMRAVGEGRSIVIEDQNGNRDRIVWI